MPFKRVCSQCSIDFIALRSRAKFCSQSCAAKARVPETIARNKSRRKYPEIPGLSKNQAHYRGTNGKDAQRDIKKRHALLVALGGKCVCCGYDKDLRGLVLDHINGDGTQDRKRLGAKVFRYYINNLDEATKKIQVLCATCNQIKAFEQREHNKTRRVLFEDVA